VRHASTKNIQKLFKKLSNLNLSKNYIYLFKIILGLIVFKIKFSNLSNSNNGDDVKQ